MLNVLENNDRTHRLSLTHHAKKSSRWAEWQEAPLSRRAQRVRRA